MFVGNAIKETDRALSDNHGTCLKEIIEDCVRDQGSKDTLLDKVNNALQ